MSDSVQQALNSKMDEEDQKVLKEVGTFLFTANSGRRRGLTVEQLLEMPNRTEHDLNIDHYHTFFSTFIACRPNKDFKIKKFLSFEIPSSTDWGINNNGRLFNPNYFVDIKKYLRSKEKLLNEYKFEMREAPHSRSTKNINAISIVRGGVVGLHHAEAFYVNKILD